ncbi:MAG: zinc-ribbon domain containing protein [Oscillochloridaceae bacterium umkhey_bin13]
MSFEDKTLTCRDCGMDFVFTAGEQEFYSSKGFINEPTRCPTCRQARKSAMNSGAREDRGSSRSAPSGGANRERVAHQTTCAKCGQDTTVPFVPRGTKPVYCSNCFDQMRSARY